MAVKIPTTYKFMSASKEYVCAFKSRFEAKRETSWNSHQRFLNPKLSFVKLKC